MITEHDLLEAIAECQGAKAPNANTCIKLAAYYTILNNLREPDVPMYTISRANDTKNMVALDSETDFAKTVNGMDVSAVMPVMDELMNAVSVLNPRLYESVLEKLKVY